MTKKDYIAFAQMCKNLRKFDSHYDGDGFAIVRMRTVELALASIFKADNGRFDRERFLAACSEVAS